MLRYYVTNRIAYERKPMNPMQSVMVGPRFSHAVMRGRCSYKGLGGSELAGLVRRARRDIAFRARLAQDAPSAACSAGYSLDSAELAALYELGPTVFSLTDGELEKRARRRRRWQANAEREAMVHRLIEYRASVAQHAREALEQTDAPQLLQVLLQQSLDQTSTRALVAPCLPVVDFPAAVASQVHGDLERSIPSAVAGLLYYMGISMADDVIDHEIADNWGETPGEQLVMASIALFAGLPMQVMRRLHGDDATPGQLCACYEWFEKACCQMAAGQYMDVAVDFSATTTMDICLGIVALKTGSTGALAAGLAATMAGVGPETVAGWTKSCSDLYMSMQIASDIYDIWSKPISPDLGNGIVTLPTLYAYHASPAGDREVFAAKLRSGDWTLSSHSTLRQYITASGGLAFSLLQAEAIRQRAIQTWSQLEAHSDETRPDGRFSTICSRPPRSSTDCRGAVPVDRFGAAVVL